MASTNIFKSLIYLLIITVVTASDPDILTDFIVPANTSINAIDGNFFTFAGMRTVIEGDNPPNFKVSKASMAEFPALNGQSVSNAILQFPAGAINPPHTHPHSAELLFVVSGILEVGFIDTTNKLYTQTLQIGDMFVFPKGLVHYQYNSKADQPAAAISAFGSASAGTVSVPTAVFATGIDENILAKAFKTSLQFRRSRQVWQQRHRLILVKTLITCITSH